jgi:hypothetical protein
LIFLRKIKFRRICKVTRSIKCISTRPDSIHSRFVEAIDVPDELKTLPNFQGSGKVRELQQAAAQSDNVAGLLAQFQNAATRAEQKALLEPLLAAWAGTSGMVSLEQRAGGRYRIQYEAFGNERRSGSLDTVAFAAATGGSSGLVREAANDLRWRVAA